MCSSEHCLTVLADAGCISSICECTAGQLMVSAAGLVAASTVLTCCVIAEHYASCNDGSTGLHAQQHNPQQTNNMQRCGSIMRVPVDA